MSTDAAEEEKRFSLWAAQIDLSSNSFFGKTKKSNAQPKGGVTSG